MKKTNYLLSIATGVGITFGMMGCGGDGINDPLPEQTQSVPVRMVAVYEPGAGILPVPNDILFGGTQDLTLNIPGTTEGDFSDPTVAVNSLDGWSAVAPFSINFDSRDNDPENGIFITSLDATSVVAGSSVRVFKVNVNREDINEGLVDENDNPLPLAGIIKPTGPVTDVDRELAANLEYAVQATSATTVAIIPLVPFEQQASYVVVLTSGLRDSNGLPVVHDSQYAIVQSQVPISTEAPAPGATDVRGLIPIQGLVNAMNSAVSSVAGGPALTDIIMSYQFTVQSVGTVMNVAKAVYIDGAIGAGASPITSFTDLGIDTSVFTGSEGSAADLFKGQITLNYMLSAPTENNLTAPLNTFWRTAEFVPNGLGGFVANPIPLGNLTYANPLPQINGQEIVPLLVSIPKAGVCEKPETGYEVAIFQHGITGNRTNLIGIADSLAANCIAAIAMDLPLHGLTELDAEGNPIPLFEGYDAGGLRERTFGVDYIDNVTGAPGADGIIDSSGAHTINLANLLVARDNNRQAIFDLLYLEKSIASMDLDGNEETVDFDTNNISFIGHSLGGMAGTGVIANSDNIKAAALVNPGGGTALMLNDSGAFGDIVRAGVAAGAGLAIDDPELPAALAQFYFAAQTVLDAGDPVNTAAGAVANGVPTLLMQVLDDATISNSVTTAPLSGTEPLGRVLGLTTVTSDGIDEAGFYSGERLFTKLNDGLHSTVLNPTDETGDPLGLLNVYTEMQSQIVSFLATGGAGVQVVDPTLLDE